MQWSKWQASYSVRLFKLEEFDRFVKPETEWWMACSRRTPTSRTCSCPFKGMSPDELRAQQGAARPRTPGHGLRPEGGRPLRGAGQVGGPAQGTGQEPRHVRSQDGLCGCKYHCTLTPPPP
ncbi:hypothetical protein CEXT_360171 [Caerostris extrusa]|uniref:Uncharacterized protein n=1 Tax=Caerostris extrusa TaxID=172846 RepID=A0AAV4UJE2_CAEEX|nr:hypothetical protein CEXT_360171 [Caerostris extrusa]